MNTTLRPGTPAEAGMDPQRIEHIKDLARGWVEQGVTPSLVVLAARRGVIVLHEAYGVMGPEPDAGPLQKDAIFPMMSVTKPITATAAMCLVEDGLLGLNRPVQWYIPEFVGEGKEQVCVHHLLTHTSGLTDEALQYFGEGSWRNAEIPIPPIPEHEWISACLHLGYELPLSQAPGLEMVYCSYGFELLGEIMRRVSGRPLAEFATDRVFLPVGMADSSWVLPVTKRKRYVRRAPGSPMFELFSRLRDGLVPWASAGVEATAYDVAAFGQMFLNGGTCGPKRVLSRPSVEAMTRNQIPGIGARYVREVFPEASWGLGWNIRGTKKSLGYGEPLMSPRAFCHSGAGAFMWVDPEYDLLGVYLSVLSDGGIPDGVAMPRGSPYHRARLDLFVNAVTAAIAD